MTSAEINSIAQEAADNAVDVFGIENPPSANDAYSFISQLALDLQIDPPTLRGREFRQFRHDYRRHLRNRGVPLSTASTK